MAGEHFEVKLAALFFIRCLITGHPFKIATNMEEAGLFDDIVLSLFNEVPVFIQLKHRSKEGTTVCDNQFTQLKGDFALLRYCETFYSIKQRWERDLAHLGRFEKCIFVFYTNATVDCLNKCQTNKKKKHKHVNEQSISFEFDPNLLNTGGNFCSIERNKHPKFYEVFEKISEYKTILKKGNNKELLNVVKALINDNAKKLPPKKKLEDLKADLENLKGEDCYEEFLSRLWIFGDQKSEEELGSLIKNDVEKLLHVRDSKHIKETLVKKVEKWWKHDSYFLTENNKMWQDILKSRWDYLSSAVMNSLNELNIEFYQKEIERLNTELSKNISVINVVAADSPILTCLKAARCLKGKRFVIVDSIIFKSHQKEIMSYSNHNISLILFGENDDFSAFMAPRLLKEGNWKVILISRNKYHYHTVLDTCDLSQLNEECRETILNKHICFQGQKIQLKSIYGEDTTFLSTISGKTIVDLLNDNTCLSIGNPPDVIEYFIDRTLQRKDNISNSILNEYAVFAISGTDALRQLVPEKEKVLKYVPGEEIDQSCRIFEIRAVTDFEELFRVFNTSNIHWLRENGECFQWIQSKGNMEIFKRFLRQEQTAATWKKIASSSERLIILIAEPGMGKSVLISHIAKKMKEFNSDSWTIMINLSDCGMYLSGDNSSPFGLMETALNINGDFQKSLLQLSLNAAGNITVLLDGFDEISPDYADQIIEVIQKLLHDTKVAQIWVTSRPVMKEKLEKTFCTLSYVLKPFSKADQKAFLCKYCHEDYNEEIATEVLRLTALWLNDRLGEFAAIPLQLMMLADTFPKEMLQFRKTEEKHVTKTLDILEFYEKFVDRKMHIYFAEKLNQDIFKVGIRAELVNKKNEFYNKHKICAIFSIFPEKEFSKLSSSKTLKEDVEEFLVHFQEGSENTGIIMSVNDAKPTFIHRTFAEYFAAMWLKENYSENQGLVEHLLFSPSFEIMWIFFNRSVARCCSLHLEVLNENKHLVEQLVASERPLSFDKCGRTALHLAVISYGNRSNDKDVKNSRLEIFKTILKYQRESLNFCDNLLCWTPLKYADKIKAWQCIDLLLQDGADEKDMEFTYAQLNDTMFLKVALRSILKKGCKKIIEYLIRSKPEVVNTTFFVKMPDIIKSEQISVTPLHEASLRGHKEIVKLLIKNGANLEATDNIFGETPLLWAAKLSQWDIVNLLIKEGADVAATSCERDRKVVRLSEDFDIPELIYFVSEDEKFMQDFPTNNGIMSYYIHDKLNEKKWSHSRLFLEKRPSMPCHIIPKGNTLLHYAAKSADNDILCRLLEYPKVLNQINDENQNVLSPIEYAARARNWDSVHTLLSHGAVCTPIVVYHAVALGRVDIMNNLKMLEALEVSVYSTPIKNYLLMLAANSEQWDMLKVLIKLGLSLPAHSGTTVFHLAVKSKNHDLLHLVLNLLGVDIDVPNRQQETAFMCAARDGNLCALEHLLESGANPLLVHPRGGYTALHLAAECDDPSVVTFLLENTDLLNDINRRDSQGRTPLMRAAPRKHGLEVSRRLLQCDVECSHRYENGETLMHVAAKNGELELAKLLYARGLSPFEEHTKLRSPLLLAFRNGNNAFVEWLFFLGADLNELVDEK